MSAKGIYVGTSGWVFDDWQERFYPKEIKGADRLSYYAEHFDTVEVNASFYRTPTQAMIDSWNKRLGADFHLVVKGPRLITHFKKLEDCEESLRLFLDRVMQLTRLKVILWQLPPSLHKDIELLKQFLPLLPRQVKHAVEFRHKSWWDDEIANALASHNMAFAILSHTWLPDSVIPTADFLYMRFHGKGRDLYKYDYPDNELAEWTHILRPYLSSRDLYAFFNNDYQALAVRNALTFRSLLAD